ncbi:TonB-dependent receptor plug domain-containing protein [Sphingobacterium paludis]|uniref:TonB-dependent receptor-like protein n=1 Tax=Sphingobacterium paludis TaxID=1476465 RepID=A0A4R7D7H0_9SPHI|nr:TonB-dependent receptor plug domain-containing protein [Sphingobacterium paludis]TDS14946.1 TonB-dependent receptor-like protein [Sphingobacterium paludis]
MMWIRSSLLLLFMLSISASRSQDIQGLLDKINAYHDSRPIEKIHLHLDKSRYTAGETIWFKAYEVVGVENMMSNISKIAYIDLIDPKNRIITAIKIPLTSGLGLGDITLQDTLIEGTYRLRAYSNWMRNDSATYFFNQNIEISNGRLDNVLTKSGLQGENYSVQLLNLNDQPLADANVRYDIMVGEKSLKRGRLKTSKDGKIDIPFRPEYARAKLSLRFDNREQAPIEKIFKLPAAPQAQHSIQFFPEGGVLLSGTINKIAVKTLQPNGLGIAATTHITTSKGDTAAVVSTNALGMGSTPIFITNNEQFTTHTTFADGTHTASKLEDIQQSGYNIQVNNGNSSKLFAQVNLSADKQDKSDIYFVLQYLGRVYYVSKQAASKSELIFSLPKEQLPSGVLTISILNAQLQPLIERPIFIHKEESILPLQATLSSKTAATRAKVSVALESGNVSDSVRYAALSASVVNLNKTSIDSLNASSILSSLLLSADVKGHIENPRYYFEEGRLNDLDNLLLTQAWRKIDWSGTLDSNQANFSPEEDISIKGLARKLGRKAPAAGAKMTLVSTQNFMDFIDTVANDNGEFVFDNLVFPDSIKFLITAKDDKGKNNIDIVVTPATKPTVGINKNEATEKNDLNSLLLDELLQSKKYFAGLESQGLMEKSIAIEEVVVTAQRPKNKASESSANLNGPGNADQIISAEDLETCPTLDMCLNGRLLGVTFRNGVPYTTRGGGPMQVVLDGMYIEGDQLSMITPMDVQSIEVLRNVNHTAIYGSYGANGLLIITTKTGRDALRNYTPKGILTVQPEGFHLNKTFYKPVYEPDSETTLNQDFRTTIHWEPNLITNKEGKATFDFYTSDEGGQYLITIEGIDFDGRIVHKTLTLDVK